jgi:hypothetical protein
MSDASTTPTKLSPEELVLAKKWVAAWKETGPILERLRREELRKLDTQAALSDLLGPVDFTQEPFRPKPTSGLVQQQAWFMKRKP